MGYYKALNKDIRYKVNSMEFHGIIIRGSLFLADGNNRLLPSSYDLIVFSAPDKLCSSVKTGF